jgi:hypothetical protein
MVSLEFFRRLNPSGRTLALMMAQPLTEYFLGGEGGRSRGLTSLRLSGADSLEIWEPQPPGTLRACQGL